MSFNAYAFFTMNGVDIKGDVTVDVMGGDEVGGGMEIFEAHWGATTAAEGTSGARRGSRRMQDKPLTITKRVDGASPMLLQALAENQTIAGHIDFYDTSQEEGITRKRYTIEIEGARVVDISAVSPNTLDTHASSLPMMETVKFVYHTVTFTDHVGSTEYRYTWSEAV